MSDTAITAHLTVASLCKRISALVQAVCPPPRATLSTDVTHIQLIGEYPWPLVLLDERSAEFRSSVQAHPGTNGICINWVRGSSTSV